MKQLCPLEEFIQSVELRRQSDVVTFGREWRVVGYEVYLEKTFLGYIQAFDNQTMPALIDLYRSISKGLLLEIARHRRSCQLGWPRDPCEWGVCGDVLLSGLNYERTEIAKAYQSLINLPNMHAGVPICGQVFNWDIADYNTLSINQVPVHKQMITTCLGMRINTQIPFRDERLLDVIEGILQSHGFVSKTRALGQLPQVQHMRCDPVQVNWNASKALFRAQELLQNLRSAWGTPQMVAQMGDEQLKRLADLQRELCSTLAPLGQVLSHVHALGLDDVAKQTQGLIDQLNGWWSQSLIASRTHHIAS